eukprot:CAMPEP_0119547482 /NCGR_PEP_ID=MMETSP1352-20130426/1593_1 /TAXON_ID=265584 /ORGANISM="Stauroneis constricta, Strain CCMP1120" /LENGTH=1822 /DNA_ID=CAMNT_0007592425 /DNA_START=311 /DNA_END=5779 /DNA_ORIENTATION=+
MGLGPSKDFEDDRDRVLLAGKPDYDRCNNRITTSKYTLLSFIPIAVLEQFRRFANLYFLGVGGIMALGTYTTVFQSAISPWTTLGPLAAVISFSLLIEGSADRKRHISDEQTNNAPCVILRRSDEMAEDPDAEREDSILNGKDVIVSLDKQYFQTSNNRTPETPAPRSGGTSVKIAFQQVRRMDIRQGHLVLIKNREMVPADMIILASSGDNGSAYIETSSIDGETNLKLRTSPDLPRKVQRFLRGAAPPLETFEEEDEEDEPGKIETLEQATKRVTRFSTLAYPDGISALENPNYSGEAASLGGSAKRSFFSAGLDSMRGFVTESIRSPSNPRMSEREDDKNNYVATLTSEPPNPHVNTFSGKLTLPPVEREGPCFDISLGAENILLRGAVLRNTEWAIGFACFTGTDTKLVQNSFETPSKFSQLDVLMNYTVLAIIIIMILCISYLATQAVLSNNDKFDELWYTGLNKNTTEPWPYLPNLDPPEWEEQTPNWIQMFLLYVTLLSNFVPLSMYVTVEAINFFFLWLIYVDVDLYDNTTDTRGLARSTNVTDLGRIEYIFSDKTGTLTQNVMRFKRCSVDGSMFGPPVQKARPGAQNADDEEDASSFHPLRQLLVGKLFAFMLAEQTRASQIKSDTVPLPPSTTPTTNIKQGTKTNKLLTFNAEMFLRVMSLCHTVVVEKDLDLSTNIDSSKSVTSQSSTRSYIPKIFGGGGGSSNGSGHNRNRAMSDMTNKTIHVGGLPAVKEDDAIEVEVPAELPRDRVGTSESGAISLARPLEKGPDGAPAGFAYQAESPDEGALVSAASKSFGFQVIARDSSGIRIRSPHPTFLANEKIVEGLKNGRLTPKVLASESISPEQNIRRGSIYDPTESDMLDSLNQRTEVWSILAVNKFDSERKRMSILLRSPPELGSIPILFCKGADSAMLSAEVCSGGEALLTADEQAASKKSIQRSLSAVSEDEPDNGELTESDEWEMEHIYNLQTHLGEFASEGLRTLVLAMRILTEKECEEWMDMHKAATTAIKGRDEKLKAAAFAIEQNLSIVGATAIEDKLQVNVPNTIATLEKAGIKLWVLTGDKRETAIEIGYSTHVLTPKMHVTEVADKGVNYVRAQCAMEFMKLVKAGKLPMYQRSEVDRDVSGFTAENISHELGKASRQFARALQKIFLQMEKFFLGLIGMSTAVIETRLMQLDDDEEADSRMLIDVERRRKVRNRAEKIISDFLKTPEGQSQRSRKGGVSNDPKDSNNNAEASGELVLSTDELPTVFTRAKSARSLLGKNRKEGRMSRSEKRNLSIANLTAGQLDDGFEPLIDEDLLSLNSFIPRQTDDSHFDSSRRTLMDRLFAIDKDRRKGLLIRHLKKEKRQAVLSSIHEGNAAGDDENDDDEGKETEAETSESGDGPRALVVEGNALKHMLGDPDLEELIFSIASGCDAVIACRVSPRQKALLVKLVRQNVSPEPVTLAIGDGANDVGMIQEAHVGIGISGKEGKQAVNASDFAIAQFRFLEDLVLVHGRWNFFRLSTVVMFSFYKNAIMAGCLIVFNAETVYSGTPLFDDWVIAMLNFVAGLPIMVYGVFDRCLDKDYVKRNPEVYEPSRKNELMTVRVMLRWVILTFVHIFSLYHFTVQPLAKGGGISTAFNGLANKLSDDEPGEAEGGDLQSVGAVTFTCLILLLALKVLYESKSLINGQWPAIRCGNDSKDGFLSRLGYTWAGVTFGSIFFWFFFIYMYEIIGNNQGPGSFFNFTGVTTHVLGMRTINWLLIIFVPIFATSFDVAAKVFGNMYYPTQTQIHIELEAAEKARAKQELKERQNEDAGSADAEQSAVPSDEAI